MSHRRSHSCRSPCHATGADTVIVASLALAITLWVHCYWSLVAVLVTPFALRYKYVTGDAHHYDSITSTYLTPAMLTVWAVVEAVRLYAGYTGNLRERPLLVGGFLFLTVFPQLPLQVYFARYQSPLFALDYGFGIVTIVLLCLELVLGGRALRRFLRARRVQFRVERQHPASSALRHDGANDIERKESTITAETDRWREMAVQTDSQPFIPALSQPSDKLYDSLNLRQSSDLASSLLRPLKPQSSASDLGLDLRLHED